MTAQTHPSDATLQQFVLHPHHCDASAARHIAHCAACQAKVAAYQLVCTGIEAQPPASFSFDVTALVMPQLPVPQPALTNRNRLVWLLAALALVAMGIPLYIFRSYITDPTTGQLPLFLFFMGPLIIGLVIMTVLETYKKYQRQLNNLNFY